MDNQCNKVNDVCKITDNQNCIGGVKKHHSQKSIREKKVEEMIFSLATFNEEMQKEILLGMSEEEGPKTSFVYDSGSGINVLCSDLLFHKIVDSNGVSVRNSTGVNISIKMANDNETTRS